MGLLGVALEYRFIEKTSKMSESLEMSVPSAVSVERFFVFGGVAGALGGGFDVFVVDDDDDFAVKSIVEVDRAVFGGCLDCFGRDDDDADWADLVRAVVFLVLLGLGLGLGGSGPVTTFIIFK